MLPKNTATNAIAEIFRILVGGLFIFSGLIKLNDPQGTAIKFKEYFEVFATDIASFFHWFIPLAFPMAVLFVVLEVVLGFALLINYRKKFTVIGLAGLIFFFTFLTFYSAYFDKVTDCGCFGDFLPMTPWQSFTKDVILSIMIGYLLMYLPHLKNNEEKKHSMMTAAVSTLCFFIAYYVTAHLPIFDFRLYKVGNNLAEMRKTPEAKTPCVYEYTFDKAELKVQEGYVAPDTTGMDSTQKAAPIPMDTIIVEKDIKSTKWLNNDEKYAYVYRSMSIVNESECITEAPLKEFKLTNPNAGESGSSDYSDEALTGLKLFIVVRALEDASKSALVDLATLTAELDAQTQVKSIALISCAPTAFDEYRHEINLGVPFYTADDTMLTAMVRANPGILLLKDGVVLAKWHYNDLPSLSEIQNLIK